jgi:succinate dehydrogenase / fumarate reductase, cytochrome b subunit
MSKGRPTYLNLLQIRQPVPAVVSILHRASGAVLFLFLWLFLAALERSLVTPQSFEDLRVTLSHPLFKILVLGFIWAYVHHLLAGIRHLGIDLQWGTDLPAARASSWVVLVGALLITAVVGVAIW